MYRTLRVFYSDFVFRVFRIGGATLFGGSDDDEDDETVNALIAATSQYWGKPDDLVSSFGRCHAISGRYGPMLPDSGDYSPYQEWSNGGKGGIFKKCCYCIVFIVNF